MKVVYIGTQPQVQISCGERDVIAKFGKAVEVPDTVSSALLTSSNWATEQELVAVPDPERLREEKEKQRLDEEMRELDKRSKELLERNKKANEHLQENEEEN